MSSRFSLGVRRLNVSNSLNLLATLFLIVAIPLTVFLAQQQQDLSQQAQTVSMNSAETNTKLVAMYLHPIHPDTGIALAPAEVAQNFKSVIYARNQLLTNLTNYKQAGFSGKAYQYIILDAFLGPSGLSSVSAQNTLCTTVQKANIPNANNVTMDKGAFCQIHDSIIGKKNNDATKKFDHDFNSATPSIWADENWFVHKTLDNSRMFSSDYCTPNNCNYFPNISNIQVQEYFVARILRELQGGKDIDGVTNHPATGADGIYLDNVGISWSNLNSEGQSIEFASSPDYRGAVENIVQKIHTALHSNGLNYPLHGNMIAGSNTGSDWDIFAPYLEGGLAESFVLGWGKGPSSAKTIMQTLQQADSWTAAGNDYIAVGQGNNATDPTLFNQEAKFVLAASLLINDQSKTFFHMKKYQTSFSNFWEYPEYDYQLGQPTQPRQIVLKDSNNIPIKYSRNFACGTVTLDITTGTGTISQNANCMLSTAPIYWGATINAKTLDSTFTDPPWDMRGWDLFEQHTGKKISLLNMGNVWWNCENSCGYKSFNYQKAQFDAIRSRGAMLFFTWQSKATGDPNQPDSNFQLSDIYNGNHDVFLRKWADEAAAWGYPFFMRLDWEMNGNWYMWSEQKNGNQPGDYVKMWRHVWNVVNCVDDGIFHPAAGCQPATNVTWVWNPNVEFPGSQPLAELYPGDQYVDWVGIDGYNSGTDPAKPDTWKTFTQVFKPTYDRLATLAPGKPIIIPEVASTEIGGSKAAWITSMLTTELQTLPNIKAFLWFNWRFAESRGLVDWQIESSASSQEAFKNGIASDSFSTNSFANMPKMTKIIPLTVVPSTITPTNTLTPTPTYILDPSFDRPSKSDPEDYRQHVDFNVVCANSASKIVRVAPDDPIMYPGQPGASHMHVFTGNTSVNAFSTTESLDVGGTNCLLDRDTASYWMPELFDEAGQAVRPYHMRAYYRAGTLNPVSYIPHGLRIIAGNPHATSPQDKRVAGWQCRSVSPDVQTVPKQATIPTCPATDILEGSVVFPNCWDGKNLDSADHKSHMAYSWDDGSIDTCPASHPVIIPQLTVAYRYPKGVTNSNAYLAAMNSGLTLHADFWNAWHQTTLDVLVDRCINSGVHCGDVSPNHFPGPIPEKTVLTPTLPITVTFTPTLTPSPLPTVTVTPTSSPTPTRTPTPTSTVTPTVFPSPTPIVVPTPTPATVAILPTDDAAVSSQHAARNYGGASTLWVDGLSPVEMAFLKFDLTQFAGEHVTRAVLRVRVTGGSMGTQTIKAMNDTSWRERGINYDNRPRTGSVVTTNAGGSNGDFREIDVTSAVVAKVGSLLTLSLEQGHIDGFDFASKEHNNASYRPQLVITTQ